MWESLECSSGCVCGVSWFWILSCTAEPNATESFFSIVPEGRCNTSKTLNLRLSVWDRHYIWCRMLLAILSIARQRSNSDLEVEKLWRNHYTKSAWCTWKLTGHLRIAKLSKENADVRKTRTCAYDHTNTVREWHIRSWMGVGVGGYRDSVEMC